MAIFRQKGCTNAPKTSSQFSAALKAIASVWLKRATQWVIVAALCLAASCSQVNSSVRLLELPDRPIGGEVRTLSGDISEVAPPAVFLDLANLASNLQPQVEIAYPKPDQTLTETEFAAKIKLRGLSIYKEEATQLGPHLKAILDNQPAQDIYNLDEPVAFPELLPGSHTLRVFAVLPWGESFKNAAAYAQTTFHVLASTAENTPDPGLPLLTYNEPQGTFGAQPVLLDFYLNNAPLHLVAAENSEDDIRDWQIRCTVNGQTFLFDQWQPVYLKGLKPGQNWVQLSLVDEKGAPINNAFNSTVRLVNYDPEIKDTFSKLVRGELPIEQIGQIVIPNYEPKDTQYPELDENKELVPERSLPKETQDSEEIESLEETKSLEGNRTIDDINDDIPDNLTAPAAETDIDFSNQSKDTEFEPDKAFEAPEEATLETESPKIAPFEPELPETELPETELTKTGFLEQLRARWSAFQKAQIESQSETIQPAKAPINPSIQLYTDVEDLPKDVEASDDSNELIDTAENSESKAVNTANPVESELP